MMIPRTVLAPYCSPGKQCSTARWYFRHTCTVTKQLQQGVWLSRTQWYLHAERLGGLKKKVGGRGPADRGEGRPGKSESRRLPHRASQLKTPLNAGVVPPQVPLAESNQCRDPTDQWNELGDGGWCCMGDWHFNAKRDWSLCSHPQFHRRLGRRRGR